MGLGIKMKCYVESTESLIGLWDFGWLDHCELKLPSGITWQEVVAAYIASESFQTSFLPPEEKSPGIHGPFKHDRISVEDFELLSVEEFYQRIQEIRQPDGFSEPADDEQWRQVGDVLSRIQPDFQWLIRLRLNEDDEDRFHDWGFVLGIVFREFLLANTESQRAYRLVFSLD